MKRIKKWLFPVLTCLVVVGAAVLPPRISEARDARQLGQIHSEELAADGLPAYEPPSLLDRLALYARWSSREETIPSFQSPEEQYVETVEQVTLEALDWLAGAGVIPGYLSEGLELTSWSYVLLWDTQSSIANQAPVTIWTVSADFGDKTQPGAVWLDVDAESGLPLAFDIYHQNIGQWLPYEIDVFQQRMDWYFALLGLDVELVDAAGPKENGGIILDYNTTNPNIGYWARYNGQMIAVSPSVIINYGGPSGANG